jgi:anionic cell wall polymer biosynthesis LytR-Cps2A-Psr (LCP) family protein
MVRKKSGGWFRKSYLWVFVLLVISVFAVLFIFSLKISAKPQIISASLYPQKITDGDVLLITTEITGAQDVKAEIEHEKGNDTINLVLIAKKGRKKNL